MNNIAVIPARGGSKRIPRKNIRPFEGKPMVAYAINAAISSNLFEHVIVTTDDEEIAEISRRHGAETPFVRPQELSDDYASTVEVIEHAIKECLQQKMKFKKVCCIYPCVPFIKAEYLEGALGLLDSAEAKYCFPVVKYPAAIQRAMKRTSNGRMQSFYPEYESSRTQDLEPAFYDAGQFYWGSVDSWLGNVGIHNNGVGYVVPDWHAVDIDTPEDWRKAEILFRCFHNQDTNQS